MAVYTEVSDEALTAFLAEYEIGALLAFRGIAEGVENSNFSLRTTGGDFILTLYERRVEPRDLPWFIGLMRYLANAGLACPLPVSGRDGEALRQLCGRHAAITTFLTGVWPRRVLPSHCRPLGVALARLHAAGRDFAPTRANALGPGAWAALLAQCRPRADEVQAGLGAELERTLAALLAAWPSGLPTGHIHADLFPDNVFFLDNDVSGLIDFYFACTDAFAYDISVCLNAWCFEPGRQFEGRQVPRLEFNVTKARSLLAGYESVRPLTPAERAALPVLARGSALRFLLTRLYDWLHTPPEALVTRKDPLEYLANLRFHVAAATEAAYGL